MPISPTVTPEKHGVSDVVAGLRRLVRWLDDHADLPFERVDYASNDAVELTLRSGGYEMLTAAFRAFEALSDPEIAVADSASIDGQRHWCQLTVTGLITAYRTDPIRAIVAGICYDDAADALRNSLGTPAIPGEHYWDITGDHLASLLPAGA
jgi:hypothetical protein